MEVEPNLRADRNSYIDQEKAPTQLAILGMQRRHDIGNCITSKHCFLMFSGCAERTIPSSQRLQTGIPCVIMRMFGFKQHSVTLVSLSLYQNWLAILWAYIACTLLSRLPISYHAHVILTVTQAYANATLYWTKSKRFCQKKMSNRGPSSPIT